MHRCLMRANFICSFDLRLQRLRTFRSAQHELQFAAVSPSRWSRRDRTTQYSSVRTGLPTSSVYGIRKPATTSGRRRCPSCLRVCATRRSRRVKSTRCSCARTVKPSPSVTSTLPTSGINYKCRPCQRPPALACGRPRRAPRGSSFSPSSAPRT